MSYNSFI